MQETDDFFSFKNGKISNIDCGYTLEPPRREAVLTSTHNLCFGAKIRKIDILLYPPNLLYKSWVQAGGIRYTERFISTFSRYTVSIKSVLSPFSNILTNERVLHVTTYVFYHFFFWRPVISMSL